MPTCLDRHVIDERVRNLNAQLLHNHLTTTDVIGDGNCFFRALSVCLYGHENEHTTLRSSVANHLRATIVNVSSPDSDALLRAVADVARDGSWVGEDVIAATAEYLQRIIHVYFAASSASPRIYSPLHQSSQCSTSSPLLVAFYEPGHFRSVRHMDTVDQACYDNPIALPCSKGCADISKGNCSCPTDHLNVLVG